MSAPNNMQELVEQLLGPVKPSNSGTLQKADANFNESGDLEPAIRKSPPAGNLQIAPPALTREERLVRANKTCRCHHIKSNGVRCGSPALREEIYCYFHRIWRRQPDCIPHRPDPNGALFDLPLLEDANGIQLAIQQVLQAVLANKMDLRRASTLLYGLQTAASNCKRVSFEPYAPKVTTELK